MTFRIERIDKTTDINVKGWRIIRSDGAILAATTKREAELLLDFFTERENNEKTGL